MSRPRPPASHPQSRNPHPQGPQQQHASGQGPQRQQPRPPTAPISPPRTSPPPPVDHDGQGNGEDRNGSQDDDTAGRRKRGAESLRDALEHESRKKKRKRGITKDMTRDATLKAYKKAGRWIVRIYGPWLDLPEAFRLSLAEDGIFVIEVEEEDSDDQGSDEKKADYIRLYRTVLALFPNFKKTLEEFDDDFESVMDLVVLMDQESQSARQQDTNKMKEGIPEFFVRDPTTAEMQAPPIPRDKTGRGFNHPATARALCPRAYIFDFDHDAQCLEDITSGKLEVTADQFPNFVYNEDEADELTEENRESWDAETGLLRSSLCLWSYKCIFMGNGFWTPTGTRKKSAVGKINGLTEVTPATIAYAVAQARFALSSCEEWGAEDGQFILQDFYHAIMELFEDEEDKWAIETLAWWNDQNFPNHARAKPNANENVEPDQNSARSRIKLARLERAKERRQAAQSPQD